MNMLTNDALASLEGFDRLPDSAHVRIPVVQALYACSDESVRRGVKAGRIPKPHKLGPRVTAWRVGDLRAALSKLTAVGGDVG